MPMRLRALLPSFALLLAPLVVRAEEAEKITSIRIGVSGLRSSTGLTAWWDGEQAWVRETSSRTSARVLIPIDARCELTEEEWNGLVEKIREEKLTSWKPVSHEAFDGATLTLEVRGSNPIKVSWKPASRMPDDPAAAKTDPFSVVRAHLTTLAGRTRDITARAAALQAVELSHGCLKIDDNPAKTLLMRRNGNKLLIVARKPTVEGQDLQEQAFAITESEWASVAKILYFRDMKKLNLKGFVLDRPGFDFSGTLVVTDPDKCEQVWQKRPQDWDTITWLGETMAAVWMAASKRDTDSQAK